MGGILAQLAPSAGDADRASREALIKTTKSGWAVELASMDHEADDPGTNWNERCRKATPDRMSPRMAWRAIGRALPKEAIILAILATTVPLAMPILASRL